MRFGDANRFQSTSESIIPSSDAVVLTTDLPKTRVTLHRRPPRVWEHIAVQQKRTLGEQSSFLLHPLVIVALACFFLLFLVLFRIH